MSIRTRISIVAGTFAVIGLTSVQSDAADLNVAASVAALSCSFGTFEDVAFPELPTTLANGVDSTAGKISITCNGSVTDAQIKITGDDGAGNRKLKKGGTDATDALDYSLFHPNPDGTASGTQWGAGTPFETDLTTTNEFNVHGTIFTSNPNPTAGADYSDIVTVELAI